MREQEKKLRLLIREELLRLNETTQPAPSQPVANPQIKNPIADFQSKVSSFGLRPEVLQAAIATKIAEAKIKSSLSIDGPTLGMLLIAAVGVSGRESTYGQGKRYQWTSWAENLISQYGVKDTSIGPTQIKYGENFGPGSDLSGYGPQVGITGPSSLAEYPKAIMATIGMLARLYQKAKTLGYTDEVGVASKPYNSTGSAALDLALIGYNMGSAKITNYCGSGTIKKPCAVGSPDIVKNYMPNLVDDELTSLGYVGEVSREMSKIVALKPLF